MTPDTILRWHRRLVAASGRNPALERGRPPYAEHVVALILVTSRGVV